MQWLLWLQVAAIPEGATAFDPVCVIYSVPKLFRQPVGAMVSRITRNRFILPQFAKHQIGARGLSVAASRQGADRAPERLEPMSPSTHSVNVIPGLVTAFLVIACFTLFFRLG